MIKSIFKTFVLSVLIIAQVHFAYSQTASILPPAKTTFFDQNGKPLTSGKVDFYIPGTTTRKTTWQDAAETIPNLNPVILDAAGRGLILGSGSYRQVVKDRSNNLIWDQVTSSIGSGGSGGVTVGDGNPVGVVVSWSGLVTPSSSYVFAYGQEVDRTTYSALLGVITLTQSITCASGSPILTAVSDTSQLNIGAAVESACISAGSTILSKTSSTVTISSNAIVSTTVSAKFFPWGNGNGVNTFNIPDLRGVVLPGRCNMGGSACSVITNPTYTDPNSLGGSGGSQSTSVTLLTANLPPYTPSGTNSSLSGTVPFGTQGFTISAGASNLVVLTGNTAVTFSGQPLTFTGAAQGGTSTPIAISTIQPSKTINLILKVLPDISLAVARCSDLVDAGTACTFNVGTSGHTIPLLDTVNTWSALQTFSNVAISSGSFTGLANPVNPTDAANKAYVDAVATGLNILPQTTLATNAILPNTPTYSNGTVGVGATLTSGSNTTLTVDSTAAPLNTVVLVKNQASAFQNGIYIVTQAGSGSVPWILTRATYFDQAAEMKAGSYTLILSGVVNKSSSWTMAPAVTTVGTDPSNWSQFSAACSTFTSVAVGCVPSTGTTTLQAQLLSNATWVVPAAVTLQSRATAASLDLTGVNVVQTLGYTSAGDGGGATLKNVGSAVFLDTYLTSATLVGGSSYTNGTYLGVPLTGGTGLDCSASVTVAGNTVTGVSIAVPCASYAVGDVLSTSNAFIGGTGSGFTFTITAVSTPTASFSDSAGNHFQFIVDHQNFANALQFGCKGDWNGVDATATNNLTCLQNMLAWAGRSNGGVALAGKGNTVIVPHGAYMTCGSFLGGIYNLAVPQGVAMIGAGANSISATKLLDCAAGSAASYYIELCDSNAKTGQFGCRVQDLGIDTSQILISTSGSAAIYSNAGQQFTLAERINIDAGLKGCIKYEIGKGGADMDIWNQINCIQASGATNDAMFFNSPSTQHILNQPQCAATGTGATTCIHNLDGRLIARDLDIEGFVNGISQNVPTVGAISVIENLQMQSIGCSQVILLGASNKPGNTLFQNIATSCGITINNGQPGGLNFTGNIVKQITCVSGACN